MIHFAYVCCVMQDSERETGEARHGEGVASRGDMDGQDGQEDEGEGEENTGGGDMDREQAFAAFRLTETGTSRSRERHV